MKGTKLINECIVYSVVENNDNIKYIYERIAERKGCNTNTIKSDINTAINNMWKFTNQEKTRKILRIGECDKPSTKTVISMVKYHVER